MGLMSVDKTSVIMKVLKMQLGDVKLTDVFIVIAL